MRYYVDFKDSNAMAFMEYPYGNETMTEVLRVEYYQLRNQSGFDDTEVIRGFYEERVVTLICEKYPPNEENKVIREYLADQTKKEQFDIYNNYVLECKEKAMEEIKKEFPYVNLI